MRNYDKQALIQADTQHHFHPFTHHQSLWSEKSLWTVRSAMGSHLNTIDGEKILDFMAGLWCVNVGYGRKEIAETVYSQMLELNYYNTFFKSTTPPVAELSQKLSQLLGGDLQYIFYGSSGSESNDSIIRAVRHYWQICGKSEKQAIISRENAYHGATLGGASLSGMPMMHRQAGFGVSGIYHITQPYTYKYAKNLSDPEDIENFGRQAADALETQILRLGADNVAAFIGEPIQGAGGVIIPPRSYWPRIREICDRYNILLVADEVICGFGRTGQWFGHQTFDFRADLITMAKGITSGYLPLSAVAISTPVAKVLAEGGGEEFAHGYTYSGHPVACQAALANIAIMEKETLPERTRQHTAPLLEQALKEIAAHPLVGEARCCGLLGAFELTPDKANKADFDKPGTAGVICRDHFLKNKVILRACGDTMVMSPPLTIGEAEIDEMLSASRKALDASMRDLGL